MTRQRLVHNGPTGAAALAALSESSGDPLTASLQPSELEQEAVRRLLLDPQANHDLLMFIRSDGRNRLTGQPHGELHRGDLRNQDEGLLCCAQARGR